MHIKRVSANIFTIEQFLRHQKALKKHEKIQKKLMFMEKKNFAEKKTHLKFFF